MASHSLNVMMTKFTSDRLGPKLSPQRFRHIGATSIAIAAPEKIEAARAFLAHGDSAMTKDHYIIAQSFAASRSQAKLVKKLRRTLGRRSRPIQ